MKLLTFLAFIAIGAAIPVLNSSEAAHTEEYQVLSNITPDDLQTAKISFLLRLFSTRAAPTAAMSAAIQSAIKKTVESNPVVVYSKSYCPYCTQAKKLLSDSGVSPFIIELDEIGTFFLSAPCKNRADASDNRQRKRHPSRPCRHQRPKDSPQHLHWWRAHWRKQRAAGQEGSAQDAAQGCRCYLTAHVQDMRLCSTRED
jgi:hypothetical protein